MINANDLLNRTLQMAPRDRITIADVARAAGVSPGTVSRVLNKRGDIKISATTQREVRAAAKRLGYRPNPFASALRTQRTGVIGAIVRDIDDPFLNLVARELQKAAQTRGFELLLGHAGYDPETADRQLSVMRDWFDGLLIIGDMLGYQAAISNLDQDNIPSVALANSASRHSSQPLVSIDDARGTFLGLQYLYALGHRRIAFMGNISYPGIQQRLATFRLFVAEHNLTWFDEYLQPCQNNRREAIACAQRLLKLSNPPTAIFCMNDLMALAAMTEAWRMAWRVPEAISIIGFDDIEDAHTSFPPLTTIRQPVGDMASAALTVLARLIEGESFDALELPIIIEPHLVVRQSCAPPVG